MEALAAASQDVMSSSSRRLYDNEEVLSFVEFVVHGMFAFGLPWVVFVVVISGVYFSSSIGVIGGK
jgi:hypothetical protein